VRLDGADQAGERDAAEHGRWDSHTSPGQVEIRACPTVLLPCGHPTRLISCP
jgi:hypothetical protein